MIWGSQINGCGVEMRLFRGSAILKKWSLTLSARVAWTRDWNVERQMFVCHDLQKTINRKQSFDFGVRPGVVKLGRARRTTTKDPSESGVWGPVNGMRWRHDGRLAHWRLTSRIPGVLSDILATKCREMGVVGVDKRAFEWINWGGRWWRRGLRRWRSFICIALENPKRGNVWENSA